MKISYNWLKDYLEFAETPVQLAEILTEIGLEVEGVEKKENITGGLEGIVVGEVRTVEKHPNADRLKVTAVDVGQADLLPIVCGAPNVAPGQKVLVALVGATLYPTGGDSFEIKKAKIRGEVSQGMICAEDEVGLGEGHEGIMVLDPETKIGQPAAEVFQVMTDYVYDIGLTPNRSDATSHMGVARDLAAALTVRHGKEYKVKTPDVSQFHPDKISHEIIVEVQDAELCPRYSSVTISDLKAGPSPQWMTERLASVGVRSINNLVDITNFILHELGQPLHAFDLRALKGSHVYVEQLPEGTKFVTLDGTERILSGEELMICNARREPMCIAGVYGGLESGVTEDTKDIFLESAHFNAVSVRKSSVKHNLRTDAAKVFEKGSDPALTEYALQRAALLFKEYAGGVISSGVSDVGIARPKKKIVVVRFSQIRKIVGVDIPQEEIMTILEALNFQVLKHTKEQAEVAVPTDKADVTREADVIEEILRIYGFNKIPVGGNLNISLHSGERDMQLIYQDKISALLVGMGLNEGMALSFAQPEFLPSEGEQSFVRIHNTSNKELEVMRPTMISSALAMVSYNQSRQNNDLKIFEFGRDYSWKDGRFTETQHLTITLCGAFLEGNWMVREETAGFFHLKSLVTGVLEALGLGELVGSRLADPYYRTGIEFRKGGLVLAKLGEVDLRKFPGAEVRGPVLFADILWGDVLSVLTPGISTRPLSRFPVVERDLALIVSQEVTFADVEEEVLAISKGLAKEVSLFDIYENEETLGAGKRSYGIKIVFSNSEKTLSDKEVDGIVSKILKKLKNKYGIYLR